MSDANKNILLISYYFPPMGMGGVQRAYKTAKYLALSGWNVQVICCDPSGFTPQDQTLLDDLPQAVKIHRIIDPLMSATSGTKTDSFVIKRKSSLLQQVIRIPDSKLFWSQKIKSYLDKIVIENEIKYLITTSPPPSLHLAGLYLKKKFNLKWLADFRDPWFADDHPPLTFFHRIIRDKCERDVLITADHVSVVTSSHLYDMQSRFENLKHRIVHIPNGYDPDDFLDLRQSWPDSLTITHCGTLCSKFSVLAFFECLAKIIQDNPGLNKKIKFVQIGAVNQDIHCEIENKYKAIIDIEYAGYLNHKQALQKTAQSSAIVIFSGLFPGRELNLPGKLYESLAYNKTCLAVFRKLSSACDILNKMPAVHILDPMDNDQMIASLNALIAEYKSGQQPVIDRSSLLDIYSRKYQAGQMAELLMRN